MISSCTPYIEWGRGGNGEYRGGEGGGFRGEEFPGF